MAVRRAVVLAVAYCLAALWCLSQAVNFVSPPREAPALRGAPEAAAVALGVAAAALPEAAQAAEKWKYQEPSEFGYSGAQVGVIILFVTFHAIGVVDFTAKKQGTPPAIPVNPARTFGSRGANKL
mmetsp:Transcript_70275/g.152719  ORF Transcript_70275/g.152719 Transcript_70275/m.152719 type:complete len:125 (+) Transcript_70275:63-437(+)